MSVAFRSSSTAVVSGFATSLSVNAPPGVANGDLLIAAVTSGYGPATFAAPSGWAALGGPTAAPEVVTTAVPAIQFFTKQATTSEPVSYTFGSTAYLNGIMVLAYSGAVRDTPFATATSSSNVTSFAGPSVTTTVASELVVAFWYNQSGVNPITLPGGVTSRAAFVGPGGIGGGPLAAGDYTGPSSPGSSAPGTATDSFASQWVAVTLCVTGLVPYVPVLLTPILGGYVDANASGGVTFTWRHSAPLNAPQTGGTLRYKPSGGSYTSATLSTSSSYTLPAATLTNGITYYWSVQTNDSSGSGPWSSDFTFVTAAAPSVTVSGPTGTSTSQQPTVAWSNSISGGYVQSTYRVVTYSAAQYSAGGFTPGSGPSLDDSGAVTATATSYTVATLLPPGTAVRSYVQVTQTPGGQASAWQYTGYTVGTSDLPPTPTITATVTTDSATLSDQLGRHCPVIQLQVQAHLNALSSDDSSFEASVGTWTATNAALAQSTTRAQDQTYSLLVTPSAAGAVTLVTGLYAVQPTTQYTAVVSDWAGLAARSVTTSISWYTSAQAFISTSSGTAATDSTSAWTQSYATATSPSNAAYAKVQFAYTASGTTDTKYLDECGLFLGGTTTWSLGGFVGLAGVTLLRSDGLYVRGASSANPAVVPAGTQAVTVNDYEVTPGVSYTYTAQVVASGSSVGTVASSTVTSSAASISTALGFWELDPLNPSATAVPAQPTQWNPSQTEQSAAHPVLGQQVVNVVAYAVQKTDLSATFELFSAANYTALVLLCTSQRATFISDPFGFSYYFRLSPAPGGMSMGMGNKAHDTQLQASTSAAPHRVVAVTGIAAARPLV